MPKIDSNINQLSAYYGQKLDLEQLDALLPYAKGEIDSDLADDGSVKLEFNDTNRPDLWSTAGLARQLRSVRDKKPQVYDFLDAPAGEKRIEVQGDAPGYRPFVFGFVAKGKAVDAAILDDLIQSQEKLCWNFGQKRKAIAMGIYRSSKIKWPVAYTSEKPDFSFTPLGFDEAKTLDQILDEHEKGQEYGHIVKGQKTYPLLKDSSGQVLSFPPIINSNFIGAVKSGDDELLVEVTGTSEEQLILALNIMACDMADMGFSIEPVTTVFQKASKFGSEVSAPRYFQEPVTVTLFEVHRILGAKLTVDQVSQALDTMGLRHQWDGEACTLWPSPVRNDFLHPVDIIEDIMMGRHLDSFNPQMPEAFTVGRLSPVEQLSRQTKSLMVGLGYQEMIFNYLGSAKDYITKMYRGAPENDKQTVQILNPMSENYAVVRPSIFPSMFQAESVSAHAAFPHQMFEVGKIALRDDDHVQGSETFTALGFTYADPEADINLGLTHVSVLMYYLGIEYRIESIEDMRFFDGRAGAVHIRCDDIWQRVGVVGEFHPEVLENWGVGVPVFGVEIILEHLLEQ